MLLLFLILAGGLYFEVKFHTNYTLTVIATSKIRNTKEFNFNAVWDWQWLPRGLNLRPCTPLGERLFLTSFCRLSQCPGVVAVWYNLIKSRPVRSGRHFMFRYDSDQDLGLFRSKPHPARPLMCQINFLSHLRLTSLRKTSSNSESNVHLNASRQVSF